MTQEELSALQQKVGADATAAIKRELDAYDIKAKEFASKASEGKVSKEDFEAYQKTANTAIETVKAIAEKQGTTLQEISLQLSNAPSSAKSIAETLKADEAELKRVKNNGVGTKDYMITTNSKGEMVMYPLDYVDFTIKQGSKEAVIKTTGPNASVSGVVSGAASSISQSIDSATLLRLGGDAPIFNQFRNSKWVFDLCNVVQADPGIMMAMWFEEQAKAGASATVAEGAPKPSSQYIYQLKSSTYKKEATLIGVTQEWNMDFTRLQADAMDKGRLDLINRINTQLVTNILAASTAYNTAASYKTAKGGAIATNYNDYFALDAMAAQVDSVTFGSIPANAAVMSTYRYHGINTQMDTLGRFLTPPPTLTNMAQVGNPAMATDDVIVGNFKEYNVILRGGLIMRVGYNGTDFAQNMFSVVLEQYYFDYISAIRAAALVKGQTFAAMKTALTT